MGASSELFIQMQDEMINSIHSAENGDITVLEALISLEKQRKPLEDTLAIIKGFKDDNIDVISNESEGYKDGYNGYDISVRSGGAMYNYKEIKDWQECEKAKKDCEDRHKQAFLSKQKGLLNVSEDGEEIELPKVSYRKLSVIIKKLKL